MKQIAWIHGLNSTPSSFKYILQKLPKHNAHLINYHSHQPLSESIMEVISQLPKGETLSLVGHSLGGVIAALIAADNADSINELITISSPLSGSRAAGVLRWLPGSLPIINDIYPRSPLLIRLNELETLSVPTISIVSTGGHLGTSSELNDSVVALSSQRALKFGEKIDVKANHFEVLLHDETVGVIKKFLFPK